MQDHITYFKSRSADVIKNGYLDERSAGLYRDLYLHQSEEHARYAALERLPAIRREHLPLTGNPGIILNDATIEALAAGARPLAALVSKHHPGLLLDELAGAMADDVGALREIMESFFSMDNDTISTLALRYKTGTEEYVFMLSNILRPFMVALREKTGETTAPSESERLCPFCGYYPDMSILGGGEDGGRFLQCALCEHRWPYKRIACTICGTEDASRLEYLSSEKDRRYRIDVCDKCGGYIKTVQLERKEDPDAWDLAVENILTARLDSAAIQKGFRRP
ncbi:MAG: formate dehydrogenase accessory protein FdhE [Spirochaetes bacterium]|nr:formate dehydrogenase accessory protein FdhE [Spirochaetota bacterium]